MTQGELTKSMLAGEICTVGEFRDWEVKERPDAKNPGQFNVVETLFILHGRDVCQVVRFLERGKRGADAKRPEWPVGSRVGVKVTGWERSKWGVRASGSCELLEAEAKGGAK